ncbi:hypothetical protein E0L36_19725 [Streptomyces sp. AJS327]|uniref:hypothetical protein n=1 Tax=Streptomyces sp. AJS327 TaxID=2545265 RepID=UPI0015DDEF9C|nr:hypothetical protein [Streptomyces sp. AJS327]MBA0053021.1 hypothetical protein [Streptomyces sp. AJS327]
MTSTRLPLAGEPVSLARARARAPDDQSAEAGCGAGCPYGCAYPDETALPAHLADAEPVDGYRCPPDLDRPILAIALTCVTALLTLALVLAACQAPTPPPGGHIPPTHCPTTTPPTTHTT